jgi:hypothetical protein
MFVILIKHIFNLSGILPESFSRSALKTPSKWLNEFVSLLGFWGEFSLYKNQDKPITDKAGHFDKYFRIILFEMIHNSHPKKDTILLISQ